MCKILNTKNWTLNTGIVGCKLIDGTGNFLPESKRGVPTPWVAFTKIFGLYKISNYFGKYYAQHLSENESGKVDILVGAFMVMKRELYLEVGGFDENCFMYSDDIDLSYLVLNRVFLVVSAQSSMDPVGYLVLIWCLQGFEFTSIVSSMGKKLTSQRGSCLAEPTDETNSLNWSACNSLMPPFTAPVEDITNG